MRLTLFLVHPLLVQSQVFLVFPLLEGQLCTGWYDVYTLSAPEF